MRPDPFDGLPRYRPRWHVRLILRLMGWPMTPNAAYRAGHRAAEHTVKAMIEWRGNVLAGTKTRRTWLAEEKAALQADLPGLNRALCELQNKSMPGKP